MLKVNEIFKSIQGESTFAGLPCVFVRLTGCNLRCIYCDTKNAYEEGTVLSIRNILDIVSSFNCSLVEVTGGEPLFQKETKKLVRSLLDAGYDTLIETNGSVSLKGLDKRAVVIMDIKCPSSGMNNYVRWENIFLLKKNDQVKFVIKNKIDYEWARKIIGKYKLTEKYAVLFSPAFRYLSAKKLAIWILEDTLDVRLNVQLHKYLWRGKFQEGIRNTFL
jgi:7-carboxy-7-deazaguanine synthase